MARVAVLGERAVVEGWALGGARVLPADSPAQVRGPGPVDPAGPLTVVLPP